MVSEYLKRFVKSDISIEHFDGCPAFVEMTGAGFNRPLYGASIPSYDFSAAFYRRKEGDYLSLVSNQKKIGSFVIKTFIEDPQLLLELRQRWSLNFREMVSQFQDSFDTDLSILNDTELLAWSDALSEYFKEKVSMPGFIDGFMFYADKRLDELLKDFCEKNAIPEYQKMFSVLGAAVERSFLNEEEEGVRSLAERLHAAGYEKGGSLPDIEEKYPGISRDLKEHVRTYVWIKSSYAGFKPYTLEMLKEEIDSMSRGDVNTSEEQLRANVEAKTALIARYVFTEEIRAIAKLTELLIHWQDQRKEYTLRFVSLKQKVLDQVARRSGLEVGLLAFAETADLKNILNKTMTAAELMKRREGCIFIYEAGNTREVLVGEEAAFFFTELSAVDTGNVSEIKGNVASTGYAKGIVRIITSAQQIDRVQEGDILVAPMTRPEHIQGMKKAGAIVTDDGGITCHAAIVSRELKKPCIIGTKIATKVFKDGDTVEVDANNGIVRKL